MRWHKKSSDEVLQDFDAFLREFQDESDRGSALLGAILLDERLRKILEAFLVNSDSSKRLLSGFNAPLQSFWSRTEAAHAPGLVSDDEYDNLSLVRNIRNEFAHHSHGLTFNSEGVSSLCRNLTAGFIIKREEASREEGEQEAREVFGDSPRIRHQQAMITLLAHLMSRAHFVEKEKRQPSDWPIVVKRIGT